MSNKIPCGGFYLDDMLNVNDSGELSIKGGTPYQQLVTDGDGNTKWEDRLAYEKSRVVVDATAMGANVKSVKVADEVPSWASIDVSIKSWANNGETYTSNPEQHEDMGNGSFGAGFIAFITTDNVEYGGIVFPEKGVYFAHNSDFYIAGIASADSDTPEITWDGNLSEIKKIDKKFIPNDFFFRVTFKRGEDGNLTADKTFEEVFNAYESGENVSAVLIMGENSYTNLLMTNAVADVSIVFVSIGIEGDNVIVANIIMSVDGINMVTKTLSTIT